MMHTWVKWSTLIKTKVVILSDNSNTIRQIKAEGTYIIEIERRDKLK